MPALYAHNKFGKKVIKNLPASLQDLINKYPNSFRLGLQGPDILFFYKPWSKNNVIQTGKTIHKNDAYSFFENAISIVKEYGFDSGSHAYILGFICHYALDKACHPLVNQFMSDSNCGHCEIEGDFEHYLLTSDSKTPHTYPMYKLVPTDNVSASYIAPFYPELTSEEIQTALKHMRLVKRLFVAPGKTKQTVIDCLMRTTFRYKSCKGHMLTPNANQKCRHHMRKLYDHFLKAVPVACHMIEKFEYSIYLGAHLPDDFRGDFFGNLD